MANYDASVRVNTQVDNSDLLKTQKEIEKLTKKLETLRERSNKLDELGGSARQFESIGYDIEKVEDKLYATKARMEALQEEVRKNRNGFKKLGDSGKSCFEKVTKSAKKSSGILTTLKHRLSGIALSLLIFNWITKGFNAMVNSMREGFKNLSRYSADYNNSMSAMKSEAVTLKNSMAAAFVPIMNVIIPYLTQLISWLNIAADAMSQFLAAMGGKNTYTKAKKQVIDYAKALDTASKSAKRALASFDELNVIGKQDSGITSVLQGGEVTGADAFETREVSKKIADFSKEVLEAIKPFKETIASWWTGINFEPVIGAFDRLRASCEPFAGYLYDGLMWFLENILIPLSSWTIQEAVPAFFDLLSASLDLLHIAIEGLRPYGEWLWDKLLEPMAKWVGDKIIDGIHILTEKLRQFSDWCKSDQGNVDKMSAVVIGFLSAIMVYYTAKKIVSAIGSIRNAMSAFGMIASGLISPVGLAAAAIGILVASFILLSKNWDKLNGAQKAATILSGLVAAATAAALAIAVFHTCWSVGIAAAAIVGGLAAFGVSAAFLSKNKTSSNDGTEGTAFYNSNDFSASPLPKLADGAVIRGGRPFAAILGDQRYGQTNIEAPLSTIEEAVQNVLNRNGGESKDIRLSVYLDGQKIHENVVKHDQIYQEQTGHSAFDY